MNRIIITAFLLVSSVLSINAQDWVTDFDTAKKISTKENKKIVLVFQGSDWCAPCIKLEQEIFASKAFTAYAKENFVMLQVDFPRRKKNKLSKEQQEKNGKLAEMYNKRGHFPLVVVLDSSGKILGTTAYKKIKPIDYAKNLNAF